MADGVTLRSASRADVPGMAAIQRANAARRGQQALITDDQVQANYILHPDRIACHVACDADGRVLGFQSVRLASTGNVFDVTPGWGIIGTHISPAAARRGIGRALFDASLRAARQAGLEQIDATIASDNDEGLGYYRGMGFHEYRQTDGGVGMAFSLQRNPPPS